MKIGIIGYGSMGKMLLHKFSNNCKLNKEDLLISNRTIEKLKEVGNISTILDNKELSKKADIVFLCIRPVDFKNVLEEIKDVINPNSLLVSLNGSISFDSIHKMINNKLTKVIPSVTAEIDKSQTLVCFEDNINEEYKITLKKLLLSFGEVIELPEDEMGMGSELVSCMPGFIAAIFDTLCNKAKEHTTIPNDEIIKMVENTITSTIELMIKNDMTFNDVVSRVATKGGITEEGTKVIYELFPKVANDIFVKTLEKRKLTKENAEKALN